MRAASSFLGNREQGSPAGSVPAAGGASRVERSQRNYPPIFPVLQVDFHPTMKPKVSPPRSCPGMLREEPSLLVGCGAGLARCVLCPAQTRGGRAGFILHCAALYSEQENANAHRPPVALPSTAQHHHCCPRDRDHGRGSSSVPPLEKSSCTK